MLNEFVDKKYPSIMLQGVLLISSVLYLEHGGNNYAIIFTVVIVLSLFVLQSISHRFYYYFPWNKFSDEDSKSWDTYLLYSMTFVAFMSFIYGLSNSFILSIISAAIIIVPGFIWRLFAIHEKVRDSIVKDLRGKNIIKFIDCPKCPSKAVLGGKVFEWNLGYEIIECIDGCGHRKEGYITRPIVG
jgi:hypothetical protein